MLANYFETQIKGGVGGRAFLKLCFFQNLLFLFFFLFVEAYRPWRGKEAIFGSVKTKSFAIPITPPIRGWLTPSFTCFRSAQHFTGLNPPPQHEVVGSWAPFAEPQGALTLLCLLPAKLVLPGNARATAEMLWGWPEWLYTLNAWDVLDTPGLAASPRGHTQSLWTPACRWISSGNPREE